MSHIEGPVVHAALQMALPRRLFASASTAGYPALSLKRLFGRDQVRARLDIRQVLVLVVFAAQQAEVWYLTLALDVPQVPAASGTSTTGAVTATRRSLLFLVQVDRNLFDRRWSTDSAPSEDSSE